MKNMLKPFTVLVLAVSLLTGCRDRDAEKRIAELESRLAEVEGKKTASETPTTIPGTQTQSAAEEKPEGPLPAIEFAQAEHDFGSIKEGDVVEHSFAFKNTGEAPLIISNAQPSCGCTVPDWTKEAIPVGGTGYIKAKFDSKGKPGLQNKTITVFSNAYPKQSVVRFKAMVMAKAGNDGPVK
jgi:hypothetical protein